MHALPWESMHTIRSQRLIATVLYQGACNPAEFMSPLLALRVATLFSHVCHDVRPGHVIKAKHICSKAVASGDNGFNDCPMSEPGVPLYVIQARSITPLIQVCIPWLVPFLGPTRSNVVLLRGCPSAHLSCTTLTHS